MSKALYDVIGGESRRVGKVYGVVPAAVGVSKNLLPVYELTKIRGEGVSCERNEDGSIHVYGTAGETDTCQWGILFPAERFQVPAGTYAFSVGPEIQYGITVVFEYYDSTGTAWLGNYGSLTQWVQSRTVEIGDGHILSIYLGVSAGTSVDCTLYPQLEAGSEATAYVPYGEVIQSVARKIKKSYDVVGGVTKQFYSSEFLNYTGEMEPVRQVEYEGKTCNLYTLRGSGILTLNDDALFWMCSGGENGQGGSYTSTNENEKAYGGRGGYGGSLTSGEIRAGNAWVVSIGAGGSYTGDGETSITDGASSYKTGSRPACGYGPGGNTVNWSDVPSGGAGSGESTYPFGITGLKAHCPGGGGGGAAIYVYSYTHGKYVDRHQGGGAGGSNGGSGTGVEGLGSTSWSGVADGGKGGAYGGGNGASVSHDNFDFTYKEATAASFYGGGGGGGAAGGSHNGGWKKTNGKAGYQGVVYILDYKGGVAV